MTITKNKENGKSTTSNGRWTDILMNVKGILENSLKVEIGEQR